MTSHYWVFYVIPKGQIPCSGRLQEFQEGTMDAVTVEKNSKF
jgi:hypothetical protein